jgi:predicted nuclease of predicted toxin-antitoxin system
MKFLLDQNISPKTTSYLRSLGHDAVDTRMLKLGEASDEDLWKLSVSEKRILITFDLDFTDVRERTDRFGPGIIIFRTRSTTSATVNNRLKYLFDRFEEKDLQGKLIIITENRIRLRST